MTVQYFMPLEFDAGAYVLRLPTELERHMVPVGMSHQQVLEVFVAINTGARTAAMPHRIVPHAMCCIVLLAM